MPVQVPAVPLPIQLPTDELGKAAKDTPSPRVPAFTQKTWMAFLTPDLDRDPAILVI